eukprot:4290433-Pyramimonas_sp.AAC.1
MYRRAKGHNLSAARSPQHNNSRTDVQNNRRTITNKQRRTAGGTFKGDSGHHLGWVLTCFTRRDELRDAVRCGAHAPHAVKQTTMFLWH